jgi:hypothetical protein
MNTNATPQPRLARTTRRDLLAVLAMCVALPLILVACEIVEVQQPSSAEQGEIIEITVTVEQPIQDDTPHRGVLSVLVPDDWAFVSATYSGDAGNGDLLEDAGWADSTEILLPAPDGMKWIGMISDEAHAVPNPPAFFDATVQLQVGETLGEFGLGYFTTNDAFGTADIVFGPSAENTADTLMNVPITVNPATSNEDGAQPGAFRLAQNYPNPFASATTLEYALDRPATVRVAVYDAAGREVAVLDAGARAAGLHTAGFDAAGLASGTYLVRLEADGEVVATRTMTRAK